METTSIFLTGPESSKDCQPQGRQCSWDFVRRIVHKLDRNIDLNDGQ